MVVDHQALLGTKPVCGVHMSFESQWIVCYVVRPLFAIDVIISHSHHDEKDIRFEPTSERLFELT